MSGRRRNQELIVCLSDIEIVVKNTDNKGYSIKFKNGKSIHLTKRRTIIALLVLIHKGIGTQADLAQGNTTIPEIQSILGDRLPKGLISDFYSDANKPFSELWNEEGFSFITNVTVGKVQRSKGYQLNENDHIHLFSHLRKALRKAPSIEQNKKLLITQQERCNFCGSKLLKTAEIKPNTFARDHVRMVADHRVPVEKNGNSTEINNYQLLCFYCNKTKWQICSICKDSNCTTCALAFPEKSKTIYPTGEDISSRLSAYVDNSIKKVS